MLSLLLFLMVDSTPLIPMASDVRKQTNEGKGERGGERERTTDNSSLEWLGSGLADGVCLLSDGR